MKKPLLDLKKNKLWQKADRIAVIGYSNKPFDGSLKDFKKLFDKKIYFPYPNYSSRKLLLQNFIEKKAQMPVQDFPYATLAHATEGFTAGSVKVSIILVYKVHRQSTYERQDRAD